MRYFVEISFILLQIF